MLMLTCSFGDFPHSAAFITLYLTNLTYFTQCSQWISFIALCSMTLGVHSYILEYLFSKSVLM